MGSNPGYHHTSFLLYIIIKRYFIYKFCHQNIIKIIVLYLNYFDVDIKTTLAQFFAPKTKILCLF